MKSIRAYLLIWLLSGVLAAILVASGFSYWKAQAEVSALFDDQLQQMAANLRSPAAFIRPELSEHQRHEEQEHRRETVIETWNAAGRLTYQSQPAVQLPHPRYPGFATLAWQGRRWRVFTQQEAGEWVLVARPLSARQALSEQAALGILLPILALLPVLGIFIWLIVGHALRPFRQIAAALDRRQPGTLAPVSLAHLPSEAQPMLQALNDLLERLNQAMQAQRQFIADAAHELRTPLAALQAQAQIVRRARTLEEARVAAGKLEARIQRAAHLAQQLLTLSRLEPEAPETHLAPVDLAALLREVLASQAPLAQEKGIQLDFSAATAARGMGDASSLAILFGNLVDNAIRYTPAGGKVTASLRSEGPAVVATIQDTGPGIPEAERTRVFDRFYRRPGNAAPGSGLGLAIVQRIAERHHATVALSTGEGGVGLKVTVSFPPAPA